MKALASFVMRGPSQAALVAAVSALLSVIVAPLALISAAAIGLVTLSKGARAGLSVAGIATVGMGAMAWLALGSPLPAVGVALLLWLPILVLALLLRVTRSLSLSAQLAGLLGVAVLLGSFAFMEDPAASWMERLEPFRETLVNDGVVDDEASMALFSEMALWMTGAFTAGFVAQLLLGLFIARWWQAALYRPGGFGEEFRTLNLGYLYGAVTLLALAVLPLIEGVGLIANLLMVLGVLLFMQGLAVVHQIRHARNGRPGWLIGLYLLLILFMPQSLLLMASLGVVDIWANIRSRVTPKPPSAGGNAG